MADLENPSPSPIPAVLSLEPKELSLIDFKRDVTFKLTIKNQSKQRVLYKLKSNKSRCFSVSPNLGEIQPKKTTVVKITINAGKEDLTDSGLIIEYVCVDALERQLNFEAQFSKDNCKVMRIPWTFKDNKKAKNEEMVFDEPHKESNVVPTVQLRPDVNDEAWERIHKLSEQLQACQDKCKELEELNEKLSQDNHDLIENIKAYDDIISQNVELERKNKELTEAVEGLNKSERNAKLHLGKAIEDKFSLIGKLNELQGGKTDEEVSNDQSQETLPYDYDPNLTCPICNKQFHSNQLQLAQQHLKSHPVDSPLTTIQDNDL